MVLISYYTNNAKTVPPSQNVDETTNKTKNTTAKLGNLSSPYESKFYHLKIKNCTLIILNHLQ